MIYLAPVLSVLAVVLTLWSYSLERWAPLACLGALIFAFTGWGIAVANILKVFVW